MIETMHVTTKKVPAEQEPRGAVNKRFRVVSGIGEVCIARQRTRYSSKRLTPP